MDNTYVKLYRSLLDHDTLSNDNTALIVFVKLLLKVNRHTGSLITGRFKLAAMTNLKPSTCWDALRRLETDSIVTLSPTGRNTTIYICNWHEYQTGDRAKSDSIPTVNREPTDTIQELRTKKKNITPAKAVVDDLFKYWLDQTGVEIMSKVAGNQKTCEGLIDVHGVESVKTFVRVVKQAQKDKFAPRVSDFIQLNARLTDLMTWAKQQKPTSTRIGGTAEKTAAVDPLKGLSRKEMLEREYAQT